MRRGRPGAARHESPENEPETPSKRPLLDFLKKFEVRGCPCRGSCHCSRVCPAAYRFQRNVRSSGERCSVMIRDPGGSGTLLERKFGSGRRQHPMNNKLYVGNLSFNTTENDLHDAFAVHGTVVEA